MQFSDLANKDVLEKTTKALQEKKYEVHVVLNKEEALETIKKIIPEGASVMNGASVTLEQVGFVDYLKSEEHKWNNLHAAIVAETDPIKQRKLREQSSLSDFYLGSVHALVEDGQFIVASNTGSQLPHIVYNAQNLIFVVSTKKIVNSLDMAMKRLDEYIMPLEDKHMQEKYGVNTQLNKIVIFKGESSFSTRKIHFLLIEEDLGF